MMERRKKDRSKELYVRERNRETCESSRTERGRRDLQTPKQRRMIYLFVRIVLDGEKDVSKGTFSDLFSDSIALHALSWDRDEL
jgi:hypothetical protein